MQRLNSTTYTRVDLEAMWKELQDTLPDKLKTNRQDLKILQGMLREHEESLGSLQRGDLNSVNKTIAGIEAQINMLTLPRQIEELYVAIQHRIELIAGLEPQRNAEAATIVPLAQKIENLQMAIAILEAQTAKETFQDELAADDARMRELFSRLEIHGMQRREIDRSLQQAHSSLVQLQEEERQEKERLLQEQQVSNTASSSDYESSQQGKTNGYESSLHGKRSGYASAQSGGSDSLLVAKIGEVEEELRRYRRELLLVDGKILHLNETLAAVKSHKSDMEFKIESKSRDIRDYTGRLQLRHFDFKPNMYLLRDLLSSECQKKDPHDLKLRQLNGEINEHNRNKIELGAKRSDLQASLARSAQLCLPFADNCDVADLKSKLKVHQATLASLNGERDRIESDIKEYHDNIIQNEAKYSGLVAREEKLDSNTYLKKFCKNPRLLLTELGQSLHEQMNLYDEEYPAAQHPSVRACLREYRNRIDLICTCDGVNDEQAIGIFQTKYCQLSGLIWYMRERTMADGGSFVNYLDDAFDKNCIDSHDALQAYEELKSSKHEFLHDLQPLELAGLEERDYAVAAAYFKERLALKPNPDTREMRYLHKTGLSLLACVDEMKSQAVDKPFDINLHTKQLREAAAVLRHPEDRILRERLKYLGSYNTDGQPSMVKKVFGMLAMFIGAAAAVAGGLILAGVLPIVSLPLTATCFGAGATLFAGGLGLLVSARQKGIDKAQGDFDKASVTAGVKINPHSDFFPSLNAKEDRRPDATPKEVLAM